VRPDGGGKQRLLDDAAYPSWRTDGRGRFALYFTSKATGTAQAWRTPAAF
jgi:hypothetical protein